MTTLKNFRKERVKMRNEDILHRILKKGSGNYNVLSYLMTHNEALSVAEARSLGLTNDLRSRISDLKNKYNVTGLHSKEVEGHTGAKYVVHWLEHSTPPTIKIKVKNAQGKWLHGTYNKESNTVHYEDGRTQKVELEDFERHIQSGTIMEDYYNE